MYESFFGLTRRPFVAAPAAERFFPGSSIEAARSNLARCVERAAGAGLVVGPSGVGKTMLLQVLAQQFQPQMRTALLGGGHLPTRRALLKVILFELGLPYRRAEEGDLRLTLIDFLTRGDKCAGGLLLLVDEAHTLPARLLEEVRLITNLTRGGQPCVQLVLAGAPPLEERLANPKLESLNQRIAARCYLEPLAKPETRDYVRYQIAAAGGSVEQIFAPEALDAIHRATDGVPRLVNQVCDHALMLAFADDLCLLDAAAVERAWADLQQLPAPWVARLAAPAEASTAQRDILEFGDLADETAPPDDASREDEETAAVYAEQPSVPLASSSSHAVAHDEVAAEWEAVSAASTFSVGNLAGASAEAPPLEPQHAEELDRSGLRIARADGAPRPVGDPLHEEVVVDLYAELDARMEQHAGRSALASGWTHSTEPDWLAGLPQVKENSPEETLSLAEALLLREMAADEPPALPPDDVPMAAAEGGLGSGQGEPPLAGAADAPDNATPTAEHVGLAPSADAPETLDDWRPAGSPSHEPPPGDWPVLPFDSIEDQILPFDEADRDEASLLPLSSPVADSHWQAPEPDPDDLAGETLPLPLSDGGPEHELSFGDADDHDLIVVEDDPPAAEPPPAEAAVVRPREFRQLFARLRRG